MAEKENYTANGKLIISKMMIDLFRVLIRSKPKRDEKLHVMAKQLDNLVAAQSSTRPLNNDPRPITVPQRPTYAERIAIKTPQTAHRPNVNPPMKDGMRLYQPGRAVIHSNPLKNQIDKLPKALFVQRANETLARLNARVQDELITVTGAHVMNSGDVVFYTKNKIHQKWLMDNKHLWSKHVHTDLKATPSTWSVLAHGIPKDFDPASDHSKTKLAQANRFKKEDLIRIQWLSDNMNTAKRAGSIVLSFASKDIADQVAYTGIFLDYDYHRVTHFKPYPAQCFKCLKMGHFRKWCRQEPRCGKCDGSHMTKECPDGMAEITECVRYKEGLRNKTEGIDDINHSVFSVLCPFKRLWLQAKSSRSFPLPC